MLSDAPNSPWRPSGAAGLKLPAATLGLRADWQKAVQGQLGSYAAMLRRNLGDGSDLHLPAGPNALWPEGLFAPPEPR
jgi:hypothetical protein